MYTEVFPEDGDTFFSNPLARIGWGWQKRDGLSSSIRL
jgi:hypothetical protein